MIYTQIALKPRGTDPMGSGAYKAVRGAQRQHRGIDLLADPGWPILAPMGGEITKLGYPYGTSPEENKAGGLIYRYVQITDIRGHDIRLFYVEPGVQVGDMVYANEVVGIAQNIGSRRSMDGRTYQERGMGNHIHIEVRQPDGSYIDPAIYV